MHSKGNHKQDEKTTLRMRENICRWSDWQGVNFQNIQIAQAVQLKKKKEAKQPNQKTGRRPKETVLQRRHRDDQ